METFAQVLESVGGAAEIAERSGVSRPHLVNIAARRKRLTPDVMALVRPFAPDVPESAWIAMMLAPVLDASSDTDSTTQAA